MRSEIKELGLTVVSVASNGAQVGPVFAPEENAQNPIMGRAGPSAKKVLQEMGVSHILQDCVRELKNEFSSELKNTRRKRGGDLSKTRVGGPRCWSVIQCRVIPVGVVEDVKRIRLELQ